MCKQKFMINNFSIRLGIVHPVQYIKPTFKKLIRHLKNLTMKCRVGSATMSRYGFQTGMMKILQMNSYYRAPSKSEHNRLQRI